MKKFLSLLLSLSVLFSAVGMITVSAAEVTTSFKDETGFYFSFENESDFSHASMQLDEVSNGSFKTEGVAKYCEGANGSKGAVAAHVEVTATGDGITNSGVSSIYLDPGLEYELSMDVKLFSPENFAARPDVHVFFMTHDGSKLYTDQTYTEHSSSGSYYTYYTISGADVFSLDSSGNVSGDWGHMNYTFKAPQSYNAQYAKSGEPVKVYMFIRFGNSPHGLNGNASGFTEEFKNSCETFAEGSRNPKGYWIEYAIDNIGLRPASIETEESKEEDTALWRASFEDDRWATETRDVTMSVSYASTALSTDVPEAIADTSTKSLEMTYTGCTGNGGYTELVVNVENDDKKIWYNRAYEISFWAKGSTAVVDYYDKNQNKTCLISERTSSSRLERTRSMWDSTSLQGGITTEWTKYTYLYYEELPISLGRDEENSWNTRFDLRFTCVPSMGSGTEGASAYKIYLDDFTVTPLDIVHNGDLAVKAATDADYGTVWYDGSTNTASSLAAGADTHTPSIFNNGTIETVSDFPEANSKNVLNVTKDNGTPYQSVDIENGKTYKVSFWAKAKDEDSVNEPIGVVLDRDIQGAILDNTAPTYFNIQKWAGYYLNANDAKDVTLNTSGYDGYGAPTGKTGSIPFYLYGGTVANAYHNPVELKPSNYEETLVYDDYYDRMFSKNTQEGKDPTAWAYQYYDGTKWVGTNDKDDITSTQTLSDKWTLYTMEYTWNYSGKHYRMPKLTFLDNASYSLTDIKIEEIAVDDPDAEPEFHIENLTATSGKSVLTSSDSIHLTWDFVSTGAADATEGDGKSLIKVYADNGGELALIGTTRADKAGTTDIKASADLFGKSLVFEVIPVDTNGNYGVGATAVFNGIIALSASSELELKLDKVTADWSANIFTDNVSGSASVYIAMYNQSGKLISVTEESFTYSSGDNSVSGTVSVPSAATEVKMFVWDGDLKPMTTQKSISLKAVNSNPFAGDSQINVVYLGDSIYAGAGSTDSKDWVHQVGKWFSDTYAKDGVRVNNYYMGVGGTTTDYSLVRVMRDVVNYNPDVVFFSHTCNDGSRDTRRNMESVVRTLMSLDNPPYIIFTRTTNRSFSSSNGYGNQVAEFYGLPLIDDLEAFKAATTDTGVEIADLFISDGVHPNNDGYKVIADEIIRCMETGRYYHKPVNRADKLVANSGAISEATWFASSDTSKVARSGDWTVSNGAMVSTKEGDTLTFSFTGDIFAFEYGLHYNAGLVELRVDGELVGTCNPYWSSSGNNYQKVCKSDSMFLDLEYGQHTVEMKTKVNSSVTDGPVVCIYNIMTGSWVQE